MDTEEDYVKTQSESHLQAQACLTPPEARKEVWKNSPSQSSGGTHLIRGVHFVTPQNHIESQRVKKIKEYLKESEKMNSCLKND